MFTTDSFGNIYFPAGASLASIPATTGTQSRVLVPGVNGRISSATVAQLITQSGSNLVTSVFGRTGVVTAALGDYNTDQITEGQTLYFSASRARKVLSITTFNTSGPATYDSSTGIINIPQYGSGSSSPTNFVPLTRKISINGQTADLSVDRIFSVEEMAYPSSGIPLSNGTSWGASITNNSANWNTAFGWGNHALAGYLTSFTETDPIWTADKPNYALKTYVDTSISNLIDTAPSTLNTLNELAAALGDDANFSTTITTLIGTKEPAITAGTTAQYWRGDKTWQTLPIYSLPIASATVLGGIKVGNNLSINATTGVLDATFTYTLPTASTTVLGGVKVDGVTITIDANGVISGANTYVLPTATSTILGGVKIGAGVTITSGVISVSTNYEAPIAAGTTAQYWRGDKSWQTLPTYDLSLYVPYTGATANVNLGLYGLTTRGLTISKAGSSVNGLIFEQAAGLGIDGAGFTTIGPSGSDGFGFYFGGTTQAFILKASSITSQRAYTMPNATGTLALTSDIVAYILPTASATVLGGIKVGTNLSIDANGVLSSTDTNTTYANFTRTVSGLVPNPGGSTTTRYLREDGTWVIPPDTDTNTWVANSLNVAGYVAAPGAVANKVWKTDASGNPAWRDDADTTYTLAGLGGLPLAGGIMTGAITLKEGLTNGLKFPNDVFGGSGDTAGMRLIARSGEAMSLEVYLTNDADDWFNIVVPNTNGAKVNGNTIWHAANLTNLDQLTNGPGYITSYVDTNTWDANTKTVAGYVAAPGAVANKVWKTDATGNPAWRDDADTDTNTTYTAGAGLTLTGTSFSVTKTITAVETADTIALRNGSGQLVATGFFQASSRSLKTNISPFTRSALDIIRDVTVVSFNYKTDIINKHIGFIAEDTPEELSTRNKNVMDSNNTIGVLLKAIQELESKVKELEAKYNEK